MIFTRFYERVTPQLIGVGRKALYLSKNGLLHDVIVHDKSSADVLNDRIGNAKPMLEICRDGGAIFLVHRKRELGATALPGDIASSCDQQAAVATPLPPGSDVELVKLHLSWHLGEHVRSKPDQFRVQG